MKNFTLIIICFIWLFSIIPAFSQQSGSLNIVRGSDEIPSREQIFALFRQAMSENRLDSALIFAEEIIADALSDKNISITQKMEAYENRADVLGRQRKWKDAEADYRIMVQLWEGTDHKDSIYGGRIYFMLGLNLYNQSRYKEALEAYGQSLTIREKVLDYYDVNMGSTFHNMGSCYLAMGDPLQAEPAYRKALDIRTKVLGPDHPDVAHPYQNLANCFMVQRDYNQALPLLRKALSIRLNALGQEHPDVASNYNMLGVCYYYMGETALGADYLEKALELRIQLFGPNSPNNVTSYINLGAIHLQSFENSKARYFLMKALSIQNQIDLTARERYWTLFSSIATTYLRVEDYTNAKEYCLKALDKASEAGVKPQAYTELYENLGMICLNLGEPEEALIYYRLAENLFKEQYGEKNHHLPLLYTELARTFIDLGQLDSARAILANAVTVKEEVEWENRGNLAFVDIKCGVNYISLGEYTTALELFNKAYTALDTISLENWNGENQERYLMVLSRLCRTHLQQWENSGNPKDRDLAMKYATFGIERLKEIKGKLSETDIFAINEKYAHLEILYLSLWTEPMSQAELSANSVLIFSICEDSRAIALRTEYYRNTILENVAGNNPLKREMNELGVQIRILQMSLAAESRTDMSDSVTLANQVALNDLQSRFNKLSDSLVRQSTPNEWVETGLEVLPADIIRDLEPNQCMLMYRILRKDMLVQLIDKTGIRTFKIPLMDSLAEYTAMLLNSLQQYPGIANTDKNSARLLIDNYILSATKLYDNLLKPIQPYLTSQVHIIPDGPLVNVPFGALLQGSPVRKSNYNTFPFVARSHSFSYGFSAGMYHQLRVRNQSAEADKVVLAMAPFASEVNSVDGIGSVESRNRYLSANFNNTLNSWRDSLEKLPYTGEEIQAIASILPTDTYVGAEAKVEVLEGILQRYKIIHLATHGKANAKNPDLAFLAFAPGQEDLGLLFSRNIYQLYNRADLVVLSACETAGGKVIAGEGALSLTRAFTLAGSRCVISSLWPVDDRITSQLMASFYRQLKRGATVDKALNAAKLELLEGKENSFKHPFYWAGYAGFGNAFFSLDLNPK